MGHLVEVLAGLGVFVAGLLARFALLLLVLAILAVPAFLVLLAIRGYGLARGRAIGLTRVDGLYWRPDLYYASGHTWIKRHWAGTLRVGVDDLAQRLLSGARIIGLPRPGTEVRAGEVATVVTCGDKRAMIASPVNGIVTAVNQAVARDPSVIRRDPYGRGWLFAVAPADLPFMSLLYGERARGWLREEGARLAQFLETELGVAAADGGEFLFPAPSFLSDTQWEALTGAFLKAGRFSKPDQESR